LVVSLPERIEEEENSMTKPAAIDTERRSRRSKRKKLQLESAE
jgi:hypothetical protein